MPYCYCTPSRRLYRHDANFVTGSKGYTVERWRSQAAVKGWVTRRRIRAELAQAAAARRADDARLLAEAAADPTILPGETMVITGTVPSVSASTTVADPVAITTK